MPILNHNDLKKVEEYQNFVRTSPFANATQDLGWEKVKEGWIGEQVYLEEDGKIIAAMSLIIRRAFAGFSLMYAPRAPICDFCRLPSWLSACWTKQSLLAKKLPRLCTAL